MTGDGGGIAGYVAVVPLPGWSDHVGEIRLVVAADRRGTGLGRALARHALVQAVEAGLSKVVVEVVADQAQVAALFTGLGFTGEAVLVDQIRDREGQLHDLLVLAHHVGGTWSAMDTIGVPRCEMACGAGHDAAVFAGGGVPTIMLFVRNEHGSHNRGEAMDMADFAVVTRLLANGLTLISSRKPPWTSDSMAR